MKRPPPHVAFFLPDMSGGGAERVQLHIMRALVHRGARVDLVMAESGGALLPLVPPEVRLFEFRAPRLAASVMPLVRYLRREKPTALHAVMWPNTVLAVAAHRIAASPARLIISDQAVLSEQWTTLRHRMILRVTAGLLYCRADMRIVSSAGVGEDLARLTGLPPSLFEVIYNPIDLPSVAPSSPAIERMWGDATERVITVGALKEQKNHALLLRAFARLRAERPGARLMLVGSGALEDMLRQQAAMLGLGDAVIFAGFHLDPAPFFASANLFVLSSDYEGFANVVSEALYAGLRVVSTDCRSGPSEILDHGKYGRLVPVGDEVALAAAMRDALDDPVDSERQKARALQMSGPGQAARYADLLTS